MILILNHARPYLMSSQYSENDSLFLMFIKFSAVVQLDYEVVIITDKDNEKCKYIILGLVFEPLHIIHNTV